MSPSKGASATPTGCSQAEPAVSALRASPPRAYKRSRRLQIYEPPEPARIILARALSLTVDEATIALAALIEGGYGVAPRNPTNGMFAAYIEATYPATGYQQVITAMSKAKLRWQAMLEQGTAMAMSLKYVPDDLVASAGEAFGGDVKQAPSRSDEHAVAAPSGETPSTGGASLSTDVGEG